MMTDGDEIGRQVTIKALRYFLAAIEQGSIAAAAAELGVVPSAVSKAIDGVEAQFELKLVHRYRAKGVSPTAAGVTMSHKVRRLLEEYDHLLADGTELRESLAGELTLGYYAPVAPAFVPGIVASLMHDNPGLRLGLVDCDNDRAQAGLLSGQFDLIVFAAENVRPGIVCEPLLQAPPYLLTAENHPLASRDTIDFAELSDLLLVQLELPFSGTYYRDLLDEHAPGARVVARASTTEMVRSLVGAGVGCAVLNMCPVTRVTYAGDKVAAVPIVPPVRPLALVLGHLADRPRRLTQVFMNAFMNGFTADRTRALTVRAQP